jgi:hypothetical protein
MSKSAVRHFDQVAVRQCWMVGLCVQNGQNNVTGVWQCSTKINPLTPDLNPSAQHRLTIFFTGDFAS